MESRKTQTTSDRVAELIAVVLGIGIIVGIGYTWLVIIQALLKYIGS